MTTIANVCERWSMRLEPTTGDPWYLDWALKSERQISQSVTVGWYAYKAVRALLDPANVSSAVEYFGGMGLQSLMINALFAPDLHTIYEYTPEAVSHLRRELDFARPPVVELTDSYLPGNTIGADLVGLDFGDLTVWKTREGQPQRELMDRVFGLHPEAVVLTDIAGPRLHLHRDRYESLLGAGSCADYASYLAALAARLEVLYDYRLAAGFYHGHAAKMALVPAGGSKPGPIVPVPETPVGLEFL